MNKTLLEGQVELQKINGKRMKSILEQEPAEGEHGRRGEQIVEPQTWHGFASSDGVEH